MLAALLLVLQAALSTRELKPQAPVGAAVERAVKDGWPRFDRDGNARIDAGEFGRWMAALTPGAARGAKALPGWTARAFAQADMDGSDSLSPSELKRFLSDTTSWRLKVPGADRAESDPFVAFQDEKRGERDDVR